jgi:hypothetical protein
MTDGGEVIFIYLLEHQNISTVRDKCHGCHHGMAHLKLLDGGDELHVVAANALNKQSSQTANKM